MREQADFVSDRHQSQRSTVP